MENRGLSDWELRGSCLRVSVGGGDMLKPRDAAAEGRRRGRRAPGNPPVPSRQASEPQLSPGSPAGRPGWAPSGTGRPNRRCQPGEAGSPLQAMDDVVTVEPSAQPADHRQPAQPRSLDLAALGSVPLPAKRGCHGRRGHSISTPESLDAWRSGTPATSPGAVLPSPWGRSRHLFLPRAPGARV